MTKISTPKKNIAYLGPEIPAISATFVYNEIIGLEEKGVNVSIFSVHHPEAVAEEPDAQRIYKKTFYLYKTSKIKFLLYTFYHLIFNPANFMKTAAKLLHDIMILKIFSSDSFKIVFQFGAASLLSYELKKKNIQHLHIHFAHVPTQIGMYAAGLSGIPFTFTAHANDIFERGLLLKEKADRAKKVITISEYNKRFLVSNGISPDRISIVRCGINLGTNSFHNPKNDIPVIGSIGRLVEKKGMDVLITACMLLKKNGIKFKLEIAGNGPLLQSLISLAEKHDISDMVDFKGPMRHDIVFDWLKNLNVFALACKRDKNGDADGIPVVLMEAMAYNIPVISTYITGVPELIEHEQSGLLSPPDDAESLYHNLRRILSDGKLRNQLIIGARKRVEEEFSQNININRIYEIIIDE